MLRVLSLKTSLPKMPMSYVTWLGMCAESKDKSSLSNKPSLDACLCGLLGEGDVATATVEWIQLVDRGGLLHVREGTYMLICAMEEVVWEHLHANKVHSMTEGYKTAVVSTVKQNEEVQFHWCMLTADAMAPECRKDV